MVSVIVAIAQNGVIGGDNTLLWHISEDLKNFKRITSGHPVVMGRKTFESLGRPLPARTNVVITRQDIEIEGCRVVHSLREAVRMFSAEEEVFIIGGGEIYSQAMEIADKFYLTRVHRDYEGDVYFPKYDATHWHLSHSEHFERGAKFEHPFTIEVYHTTKWSIREATQDDIETLHTMADESFRNTYKDIITPEQMEYMMDMMYSIKNLHSQFDEGHRYYIMSNHAGENIGYGSIAPQGEKLYHLEKLYMATPNKGKGYGTILFGHLLREIKRLCAGETCRVELNVNKHNSATEFYFRQGMKIARQGDYTIEGTEFIRPDLILYKEL